MKKNLVSIILTVLFAAFAGYYLYPTYQLYSVPAEQRSEMLKLNPDLRNKVLNLGLDLTGGMRLLLEVQQPEGQPEDPYLLDRAYQVIENRVNGSGITEAGVQKQGTNRLVIELPGLNDEALARTMIGSQAQLQFHVAKSPQELGQGLTALSKAFSRIQKGPEKVAPKKVADSLGTDSTLTDTTIAAKPSKEDSLLANVGLGEAEAKEEDSASDSTGSQEILLQYFAQSPSFQSLMVSKNNRNNVEKMLRDTTVAQELRKVGLGNAQFMLGATIEVDQAIGREGYLLYFVNSKPEMNGKEITSATPGMDQQNGGNNVSLTFSSAGAKEFHKVTARNTGERLAIVLDGYVYSAPNINEPIAHGNASITGSFTTEEATNLAVVLQAGAMPAPVQIIEVRTVGPTLGKESIDRATYAAVIGFFLVFAFMIYWYQTAGFIAISALVLNIIFVMAIMAGAGATLTLPGIAGLILIIGMAVDANVIIYERIKEELLLGKGVATAVEAGYDRAFITIIDSNITTLATAWILYEVGTGAIRGFAVTMGIGIIVSLFTALVFTKMVFHLLTQSPKVTSLRIFPLGHKGKNS